MMEKACTKLNGAMQPMNTNSTYQEQEMFYTTIKIEYMIKTPENLEFLFI